MIKEIEQIDNLLTTGIKTIAMHRLNVGNKRVYVTTEPFKVYSGLTGALTASTFQGNIEAKRLNKWRDKMVDSLGREGQESYLNSMADFGTLTHEAILSIWKNKNLDWKYEQEYAHKFFTESAKQNGLIPNEGIIRSQIFEYCKAAASLLQFIFDNVVDIYAIEGMAKHDILEIATPIDLCCKLKDGRVVTLNIKTSAQIGDHQREQCAIEKLLWNTTYPDCQAISTGILRPKDWSQKKGIPTYEFELLDEKTEIEMREDAVKRLMLTKSNEKSTYLNYPKSIAVFSGITKLGESPKIESRTLEQLFTENITNIETKN